MKTTILLVRHGESLGNEKRIFCGRTDVPLTEKGRKQAQATAEYLKDAHMDAVFASPLDRAFETGTVIAAPHGLSVQADEGLLEIWGGYWEEKSFPEILALYPEDRNTWNDNIGLSRCTGGESVLEVQQRVYAHVEQLAQANAGKTILLATHAMATRSFVAKVMGLQPEEIKDLPWPTNASVTTVEYEDGSFHLVEFSHDEHLQDLITTLPGKI